MPPHVSVVIPTYNRAAHILDILDALEQQTYRDFEVVLSIDGSTDNTLEVLSNNKNRYNYPLQILNNPNGGRALCRNRGAAATKGDLLVFYDDDCRPNPESLQYHVLFHEQHPESLLEGPGYFDDKKVKTDFHRWRKEREHTWYSNDDLPTLKKKAALNGGNNSMPKAIFEKLGGFKDDLNDGEDFELAFRAMHHLHYPIYSWKKIWAYHDDYKDFDEFLRRRISAMAWGKSIFKSDEAILRIYPERWVYDPPKSWFKRTFYRFFTTGFAKSFLHSPIFPLLPTSFRYKYYEWMVYSNSYIFLPDPK